VVAAEAVETGRDFGTCPTATSAWFGRTPSVVALELAGDASRAGAILDCWTAAQRQRIRDGVHTDTWLIAVYVATLGLWCLYGARRLYRPALRRLGWMAALGVVIAGVLDLFVENPALRSMLDGDRGTAVRATTAALAKFVLLVLAAAYAALALIAGLTRMMSWLGGPAVQAAFRATPGFGPSDAPAVPPVDLVDVVEAEDASTFARRYVLPADDGTDGVDIALSGGGIRSAAFSLGCVQTFETLAYPGAPGGATVMATASHLATVSGGGYLGGGRQMLLHDLETRRAPLSAPYQPDQPETALLHRNHNFLWDTPREAAVGIGRLLLGVAFNLTILAAIVFVIARPIGWVTFAPLLGEPGAASAPTGFWWGTLATVGILALLALAAGLWQAGAGGGGPYVTRAVQVATIVPALVGLVLVFVGWRGADLSRAWVPLVAAGGTAAVLIVLALVSSLGGPARALTRPIRTSLPVWVLGAFALGLTAFWLDGAATAQRGVLRPSIGPVLRLLVVMTAVVVVLFIVFTVEPVRRWLHKRALVTQFLVTGIPTAIGFVAAIVVMVAAHWLDVRVPELGLWAVVLAFLVALLSFGDQKLWSPHVFYKKRIASAFSGTRTGPTGPAQQLPYNIRTTMSSWGRPTDGSPKLLVCCAVHTSNLRIARTRRVWTFTFAYDFVGGPDIGWMRTIDLEAALGRENGGDGTLLAAVAMSGAAVASSLGALSKGGSNAAFAVANARLGVWLPNPRYVRRLRDQPAGDIEPWIRWRRVTYLLKEVFGVFDLEDRFVYVSDGGHVENFGLLSLLARRSRVILCCDASGDSYDPSRGPPSVGVSIRHSLRMARDRLGVMVEAVPASGAPFMLDLEDDTAFGVAVAAWVPTVTPPPGCEKLRGRLAPDCVVTFRISHPAAPGAPTTTLVLVKAVLPREVCTDPSLAPARTAALDHPAFPADSTVDQWLTTEQFDGYVALGRYVARRAVARLAELEDALAEVDQA
jgi:hypothetical protein